MALLLGLGFVDLIATAVLHAQGRITELNPVMRPLIDHGEWLFALVKGSTLMGAWIVMRRNCPDNLPFVRISCLIGALVYVIVWTSWFVAGAGHA